jgi:hypothetical protein
VTVDNDADTSRPPTAGMPAPAAAPTSAPTQPTKTANAERQQRYRERSKARASGFAVPQRSNAPHVHRTSSTRPDFRQFNAGVTTAVNGNAAPSSAAKPSPFAAAAAAPVAPQKEVVPVTREEALPYAAAVTVWVLMGIHSLVERKFVSPQERAMLLQQWGPMAAKFANEATIRLCMKYNFRIPYVDEACVGGLIGLSAVAMFAGKGGQGVMDAGRYLKMALGDLGIRVEAMEGAPSAPTPTQEPGAVVTGPWPGSAGVPTEATPSESEPPPTPDPTGGDVPTDQGEYDV